MPSVTRSLLTYLRPVRTIAIGVCIISLAVSYELQAATTWDSQALTAGGLPAGDNTQWWFDPINWSGTGNNFGDTGPHFLPPSADATGSASADTQINTGTGTLPGGEGVVYDPSSNDPNFASAGSYAYPTGGFGPQVIGPLYISRTTTNSNTLTIKGDLQVGLNGNTTAFQVGRSGSTTTTQNLGRIVQVGGTVTAPTTNLDIGQREVPTVDNPANWGNGIYDWRGGILDVYNNLTNHAIRLSAGSSGNGTGGTGRFIMHNPTTQGYVRSYNFVTATDGTNGDGIQTGVGINEFHFENGNTRPIEVVNSLSINNGAVAAASAIKRSARLQLVLDSAPTVDQQGKPQNLGLFEIQRLSGSGTAVAGTGDLDGDGLTNDDRIFSSADGTKPYYATGDWAAAKTSPNFSGLTDNDFLVTAAFGSTLYRWEISYTGTITWQNNDRNTGIVTAVSGTGGNVGTGTSIVLIGHDTVPIVPPGIPGDFNNDGKVDAADYVTWRKNNNTNNALPNDNGLGTPVGPNHYALWRTNYGKPPGAGAGLGAGSVPEPQTIWLAFGGLASCLIARRQR